MPTCSVATTVALAAGHCISCATHAHDAQLRIRVQAFQVLAILLETEVCLRERRECYGLSIQRGTDLINCRWQEFKSPFQTFLAVDNCRSSWFRTIPWQIQKKSLLVKTFATNTRWFQQRHARHSKARVVTPSCRRYATTRRFESLASRRVFHNEVEVAVIRILDVIKVRWIVTINGILRREISGRAGRIVKNSAITVELLDAPLNRKHLQNMIRFIATVHCVYNIIKAMRQVSANKSQHKCYYFCRQVT